MAGAEDAAEDAGTSDAPIQEEPVKLDNEVQSDTAVSFTYCSAIKLDKEIFKKKLVVYDFTCATANFN